jgi:CBS domain containing-hemolysin-like protein
MDSSFWSLLPGLLGVAFFVFLNAFFVAAEFGLVSVRRTRIGRREPGGPRGT